MYDTNERIVLDVQKVSDGKSIVVIPNNWKSVSHICCYKARKAARLLV